MTVVSILGLIAVCTITVGMAFAADRINYDVTIGVITLMVLVIASVPALRWVAKEEGDPDLFKLLMLALLAKVLFSLIRYFVITVIYGDNADAGVYSVAGTELSQLWRKGVLTLVPPDLENRPVESQRIAVLTALVYSVTGPSRYAGTFVFTWFCYSGQVLMVRAFSLGVPKGDMRRYAAIVLFLPSMLFWPSSIGKEATIIGFLGFVCYGAAKLLANKASINGILIFAFGAAGLLFIRPHMAMIAIVGLGFASAAGTVASMRERGATRAAGVRLGALILLIVAAAAATTQLSRFFEVNPDEGSSGVSSVLERTLEQTKQGGSEFSPPAVTSPVQIPAAIITVIYRPFPWEARNMNSMIAAAEGSLLIALTWINRRRVMAFPRAAIANPYLIFAATYAFVFILAFSFIANFGILARQRTQMLPLALTALALPALATRAERREAAEAAASEAAKAAVATRQFGTAAPDAPAPQPMSVPPERQQ